MLRIGQRIMIIGSGGAGKSTLAAALARTTELPLVHLDRLYWHPGWVPTPDAAWDALIAKLIAEDRWIMDGNYGRTLPQRLAAADTVIFLDLSRVRCVTRILRRWWRFRGRSRPDLPEGCPEQVTWEFLWWVWSYPDRRRPAILAQLAGLSATTRAIVLHTPREVEQFLRTAG